MQHGCRAPRGSGRCLFLRLIQRSTLLRSAHRAAPERGNERDALQLQSDGFWSVETLWRRLLPRSVLRLQFRSTAAVVVGTEHEADALLSRLAAEAAPDDVSAQARESRQQHHARHDRHSRRLHAVQCSCSHRPDYVGIQPAALHDVQVSSDAGEQCAGGSQLVNQLHCVLRVSTSVPGHTAVPDVPDSVGVKASEPGDGTSILARCLHPPPDAVHGQLRERICHVGEIVIS